MIIKPGACWPYAGTHLGFLPMASVHMCTYVHLCVSAPWAWYAWLNCMRCCAYLSGESLFTLLLSGSLWHPYIYVYGYNRFTVVSICFHYIDILLVMLPKHIGKKFENEISELIFSHQTMLDFCVNILIEYFWTYQFIWSATVILSHLFSNVRIFCFATWWESIMMYCFHSYCCCYSLHISFVISLVASFLIFEKT